jgi:hypothetical protein
MKRFELGAALAALSLSACAPAPLTEAQKTEITTEVTQRVNAFVRQLRAPVVDSVVAFYDSSMVFGRAGVLVPFESLAVNMRRWKPGLSVVVGMNGAKVVVLGPDAAVYSARLSGIVKDSTGQREVTGAVTFVLQKKGGVWRFVAAHESAPVWEPTHESEGARARP